MSGDVTQIIGWSLIHFLWQGAVIALLLQGCLVGCRTAAARYNWLMAAMVLMLAAPFATLWLLSRPDIVLPSVSTLIVTQTVPEISGVSHAVAAAPSSGLHFSVSWLVYAWLAGVAGLSARWLGGWIWLERIRRDAEPLQGEFSLRCRSLIRHIGVSKSVQFAQSALLAVPVVVGWLRPVVLIPLSTMTTLSPQQLDAVILHELAHIRRLDAFANLFQILVETLLFYHPAVWWVSHRIRIEREHCCDDIAVGIAGDSFGYAMALTMLEAERAYPEMALAATGGALKNRVKRLLGREQAPSRPFHLAALAVALIGLVLGGGTLQAMASVPHIPPVPPIVASVPAPPAPPAAVVAPVLAAPAPPAAPPAPRAPRASVEKVSGSYIGDMADAGFTNLSTGELISLKSVGVTADEAKAWRTGGFPVTISELVGLHASGIRPSDAAGFQDVGVKVSASELPGLKAVGVTPDYIRQMRTSGFEGERVSDYMTARSVGVTPAFVANLKNRGIKDLTPSRIITLKASGLD